MNPWRILDNLSPYHTPLFFKHGKNQFSVDANWFSASTILFSQDKLIDICTT
jgi:hypothetical protein